MSPVKVSISGRGVKLATEKSGVEKSVTVSRNTYHNLTRLLPVVQRSLTKDPRELDLAVGEEIFRLKSSYKAKRVYLDLRMHFYSGNEGTMIPTKSGVFFALLDVPKLIADLKGIKPQLEKMTEVKSEHKKLVVKEISKAWGATCRSNCPGCAADSPGQTSHIMGCIRVDYSGNPIKEDTDELRSFLLDVNPEEIATETEIPQDAVEEIFLELYETPKDFA